MGLKSKIVWGAIALATVAGTWGGNGEGSLSPVYNKKVGNSYGISIGLYNELMHGAKHYGLSIGLLNKINENAELDGISVGLLNGNDGQINGINASVFANLQARGSFDPKGVGEVNGLEVAIGGNCPGGSGAPQYYPTRVNGLQVSVIGNNASGNVFQVGLFNRNKSEEGKDEKESYLINWRFD